MHRELINEGLKTELFADAMIYNYVQLMYSAIITLID